MWLLQQSNFVMIPGLGVMIGLRLMLMRCRAPLP
jgi:hypothetical protein